jgi:hypothetical protein
MNNAMKYVAITLIGVLGSVANAFAQQASPGVTTQPAVPAPPPTAPNGDTTSSTTTPSTGSQGQQTHNARPASDVIKEARESGYALKIDAKNGNYVFCKTDAAVGTRLTKQICMDVDRFVYIQQQQDRDRNYLRTTLGQMHCNDKGCM